MADNAPYFMTGVSAQYAVDETLKFAGVCDQRIQQSFTTECGAQLWHSSHVEAGASLDAHAEIPFMARINSTPI